MKAFRNKLHNSIDCSCIDLYEALMAAAAPAGCSAVA